MIVAYLQEGRNVLGVEIFLSFLSHCCFRSGPEELAALKVLVLKLMMVCLFVTLTSHAHHLLQTVPAPPPSQQYC